MKKLAFNLMALAILLLPGCSCMKPSMQSVSITSSDPEAEIFADGQHVGKGVATAQLKRDETHTFMAKAPDGRAGTAQIGRSWSSTATLDVIGGVFFLVPFIGLLAPGAYDLDSTHVEVAVPIK
jgi:hypothetical protein